ncbi:MAG: cell division protein ZipA C-terminal FtsZ-binding domain-containing protein [Gammaproteobacteria bacterium]|jgi:FtsZ-interacting cell division protein ZipA
MDNLRLILILLGIGIVALIYIFERIQSKNNLGKNRAPLSDFAEDEPGLVIRTTTRYDDDLSTELADLKNFMDEVPQSDVSEVFNTNISSKLNEELVENANISNTENGYSNSANLADSNNVLKENNQIESTEHIVVLHIVAKEQEHVKGLDILIAAKKMGFVFGDMNIFHYYDGTSSSQTPALFNLVNMYEPGYFVFEDMENYFTKGISVFASLANDDKAIAKFETMLGITKKTASLLKCEMLGPDKLPITEETVRSIHNQLQQ